MKQKNSGFAWLLATFDISFWSWLPASLFALSGHGIGNCITASTP